MIAGLWQMRRLAATLAAFWLCACGLFACGGGGSGGEPPLAGAPQLPLTTQRVFPSLPLFAAPVAMLQAPGNASRWFVVEQAGRVRVFANQPAVSATAVFVDIAARVTFTDEAGLLGMAFHSGFPTDPRAYLFYSHTDPSLGLVSRLSEFRTADAGLTLDPASERILLTIRKPEENHNGGGIGFGPDGFLYIGVGDGGGGNDQHGTIGNAQLQSTLLGKMLRIDVNGSTGGFAYRIPITNPFAGNALCGADGNGTQACPEIFALGLRNPWRWSFDRTNGQLWVGDVGQSTLEEVDRVVLGGNFGWRCREGTQDTGLACGSPSGLTPPVAQYGRSTGAAVTGGYVYRGSAVPRLIGRYIFGDFISGRIFNISGTTQPTVALTEGFVSGLSISSFGEGIDGELYVVDYGGELHRIGP